MSSLEPIKNCFLFAIIKWVLWTQAPVAFKIGVWGPTLQVEVLKVEALDVQSKPLLLREKLRVWSSLQVLWPWARNEVYDECI